MLAVVLPSTAFARTEYLCSMDGKVRSSCCCPAKAEKTKRESAPVQTIRIACCCEVSTVELTKSPSVDGPKAHAHAAPKLIAVLVAPQLAVVSESFIPKIAEQALGPPTSARSLFARHCALLL